MNNLPVSIAEFETRSRALLSGNGLEAILPTIGGPAWKTNLET